MILVLAKGSIILLSRIIEPNLLLHSITKPLRLYNQMSFSFFHAILKSTLIYICLTSISEYDRPFTMHLIINKWPIIHKVVEIEHSTLIILHTIPHIAYILLSVFLINFHSFYRCGIWIFRHHNLDEFTHVAKSLIPNFEVVSWHILYYELYVEILITVLADYIIKVKQLLQILLSSFDSLRKCLFFLDVFFLQLFLI